MVISRYPTNQAILAEEGERGLTVELLERVFMRSAFSYKAAVYEDSSFLGFWNGKAVDKQSSNASSPSPDYWVRGFLASDFLITPAAGTRRLGVALRQAISATSDLETKQELIAASTLARRQGGQRISVNSFCERFHLSDDAAATLRAQVATPALAAQQFSLDASVFDREVAYRNLQLDSGVVITAPASQFDGLVQRAPADRAEGTERFSMTGKVVDERLKRGLMP